jgi:16S rRNA (guanine(966)-N(2))-methyltransferase RsmD
MRIIAGEFRGRRLLAPEGDVTRPITDRVKQSLFDILAPILADARVYDCFAGTGSMGLECLSRGAAQVTFFEADRSAASRLRKNIDTLKVGDRSTVVSDDLFRWFNKPAGNSQAKIDLIFLDPPYRFLKERPADLLQLADRFAANHLAKDGIVVFRHDAADSLALPPLVAADVRSYGSMTLEFLRSTGSASLSSEQFPAGGN